MARTRRRSSYRKSRRWNPRARRAKAGYVGLNRDKFRRATIWNMARRGKRTFKHLNPRGRTRRRNPSGTELRDGTSISISGSDVTIIPPYGESYDYSDVSPSAIRRLRSAKTFGQASKIAGAAGVTRSINPRRRSKGRGRKSRSRSRSSRHRSRSGRGRSRGRRSYARR
jgi:hypothetical protein